MRLKSHLLIADITCDLIEEISEVKLNRTYLKIGSIMPDIIPTRRSQLHLPSKVHRHYEKELQRIIKKNKRINGISFVIGLLTHYITDAFCLSHNVYVSNLKKHIQYEYLLNDFKDEYQLPDDIMDTINEYISDFKNQYFNTESYIEAMSIKYLEIISEDDWHGNVIYDIEQAIIHVVTVLTEFISELRLNNIQGVIC